MRRAVRSSKPTLCNAMPLRKADGHRSHDGRALSPLYLDEFVFYNR
jgi:hypothetical protein